MSAEGCVVLAPADLTFIIALIYERSGISLTADKAYLVEGRLMPLVRQAGLRDLGALVAQLRAGGPRDELVRSVVESMTTHESSFFRDTGVFDHLARTVLPELAGPRGNARRLRVWSAACAFGQEPLSCAMLLTEQGLADPGFEIVATDLSGAAIARCRDGLYSSFEIERGLSEERRRRWFRSEGQSWRVSPDLARRIQYRTHNLLHDDVMLGRFDIVFIRNVLIYFDRPTRQRVLGAVCRHLADDGILIVGGTEDPSDLGLGLEMTGGRGFYRLAQLPVASKPFRLAAAC